MPAVSPNLNARERACVEEVLNSAELAYVAMIESARRAAGSRPDALRPGDATLDARPYVTPMNFAYDPNTGPEGRLLLHTGPGRKVEALATSPYICVSITVQTQLHLGDTPCQDGYLYQSVILEGRAALLTDQAEREAALRAIVAKYDPGAVDKPFDQSIFAQTLLYAVNIDVIGFKERPKQA